MKKFTRWIAAKLIKNHQSVNDLKVRARYGTLEGWASIIVNLLLFVAGVEFWRNRFILLSTQKPLQLRSV